LTILIVQLPRFPVCRCCRAGVRRWPRPL